MAVTVGGGLVQVAFQALCQEPMLEAEPRLSPSTVGLRAFS